MVKLLGVSAVALIAGWAGHAAAQMGDDHGADPADSGQIVLGTPQTGTIETAGDADWFAVNVEQGIQYQIDLEGQPTGQGSLEDPLVELFGPGGEQIARDDDGGSGLNSRLRFTADQSGVIYIAAGAYGGNTGTYTVTVQEYVAPPDDYVDDAGTDGVIGIGDSVAGDIGHEGDSDWFAVELAAGQSYAIDLEGAATGGGLLSDPYLELFDSDGEVVDFNDDGGEGLNSRLIVTPDRGGRYYIGAAAFGGATGSYTLSIAEYVAPPDDYGADTGTAGSVVVGGSAGGDIEVADDADWFGLDLAAGDRIMIDLEGSPTGAGTLSDPYLTVYDASGAAILGDDDGGTDFNSRLLFEPPAAGRYYLEATSFGSATGTYTLTVSDVSHISDDYAGNPSTAGRLPAGGHVVGELELAGDVDWFAIRLEAEVPYAFFLEGMPTDMGTLRDPYLSLYDDLGQMLAWNDDDGHSLNSLIEFIPDRSGTFYLEAGGYADASGSYTLTAEVEDGIGDVRLGEVHPDWIDEGDNIAIVVELVDGERLTILVPRDYLSEIGSVYIGPQ